MSIAKALLIATTCLVLIIGIGRGTDIVSTMLTWLMLAIMFIAYLCAVVAATHRLGDRLMSVPVVRYSLILIALYVGGWILVRHPEAVLVPLQTGWPKIASSLYLIFGAIALIYILRSIERTVLKRLRAVNIEVRLITRPERNPELFETHADTIFTAVEKRKGGYIIDLSPAGCPGELLWVNENEISIIQAS